MTTTTDPKTVQQLATEHILDDARRAHDIGAAVLGHFGPDALTKAEFHAYCDAVREAITTATVAVSWPDEQPQGERDAESDSAAERVRATLDRHAARGSIGGEYLDADVRAVLDNREMWRNLALSRGAERDERDAALADLATELDAANANAAEIADQRTAYREEVMRLRARVRELEGAQAADDTTRVDALRHTDDTPDAERLAQIRDRNRRLAAVPFETHGGGHGPGCIPCELVRAVGDVQWLLERMGEPRQEWGLLTEGSKPDQTRWVGHGDLGRRTAYAHQQQWHQVMQRVAGEWKAAEQQPEDGDRG